MIGQNGIHVNEDGQMNKKIILLDDPGLIDILKNKKIIFSDKIIYPLNLSSFEKLNNEKIPYENTSNLLTQIEREEIFDLTVSLTEWYENKIFSKDFLFENVNLLGMIDGNEFHMFLTTKLLQFAYVKKIIEKEVPDSIISTTSLKSMISILLDSTKIITYDLENNLNKNLTWDEYNFIINFGFISFPISISRKNYVKGKDFFEKIICNLFSLNHKINSKKTILLLEFNPDAYSKLFDEFSKKQKNILIYNKRRSAVWNFKSIQKLIKSKSKILNPSSFLTAELKQKIQSNHNDFQTKLTNLWSIETEFSQIFNYNGKSFWQIIRPMLEETFEHRLLEYLTTIVIGKKIFESMNITCILNTNEVGETEKAILGVNNGKKPSIMLEHYFANYTNEISRYDAINHYQFIKGNISVWGNSQKNYLLSFRNYNQKKIIVNGSPRHDYYFKNKHVKSKIKTNNILLSFHPISEIIASDTVNMQIELENFIIKLTSIIKTLPAINLIVKLHPSPLKHHHLIKNFFKKIDPSIKIIHTTSTFDVLNNIDFMINVSEFYSPSTIIMEAMILEKPILFVPLYHKQIEFDFIKSGCVLTSNLIELEKNLRNLIFDISLQTKLINNSNQYLNEYLENHGTASQSLVDSLDLY